MTTDAFELVNSQAPVLRLPYCPHDPTAKQEFFLLRDELEVFFGGSAGPGKLLNCSTPVPTPGGWTTIGALQVGDEVFGENGQPCRVEWLSDVDLRPESYRLVFDDGSEIEACADHLWLTFDAKELAALTRRDPDWRARRRARRPSRATGTQGAAKSAAVATRNAAHPPPTLDAPRGTVRTTSEIAATLTTPRGRRNHAVPVAAPLELPEADLLLHPYMLGVWLGDGHTNGGMVTTGDEEILAELRAVGWESHRVPSTRYGHRIEGLSARLRELGLLGEKRVPPIYLRGSIAQRLALLQGMMDTDGTVDAYGRVEFTNTNERLARAVHELACSLGQKPTIIEGHAKLNGRDYGPVWDVAWTPTLPVFRLTRKLARQRPETRRTNRFRYIVACDRIAPRPMRCIRVANPSSLFLVGNAMIPTHNSWALLMAALQHVDMPGYHALLLRPELTEFEQQGGLIEVAHDWLGMTDAYWNGTKRQWTFPSGATVKFGYLANQSDLKHYKGGGVSFCGFDELTSFPDERLYLAMFRVLRQGTDKLPGVPLRMRSASNPGDIGHFWTKDRFVDPETREPGALYIPARMRDNPFLNVKEYLKSLAKMHPTDRQRLIDGDWDVAEEGSKFRRANFVVVEAHEALPAVKEVRYWDLAATEPNLSNPHPDYTVGLRYQVDRLGNFAILDIVRGQWADHIVEERVRQTATEDGRGVHVYIEQDPGQAGKALVSHYKRRVLQGFPCHAGSTRINGRNEAKEVRARPAAAAVGNGLVQIVRGPHLREFLDEVCMFPNAANDDCVDALSGAHNALTTNAPGRSKSSVPRARIPGVQGRAAIPGMR